jgi:hypothetical protein
MDKDPRKPIFLLAWLVLSVLPIGRLFLPVLIPLAGG